MQTKMWNFDEPLTDQDVLWAFREGRAMTRRDVALELRRAKSPTLVARMNKLVHEGFLSVEFQKLPNGVDMWVYSVTRTGTDLLFPEYEGEGVFALAPEGARSFKDNSSL